MSNFTAADLEPIAAAKDLQAARELMRAVINKSADSKHATKPEKVRYLLQQVDRARTVVDVAAIGYNMLLSGEGLSTVGSRYQRKMQ